jgi:hypothetical protein
MALSITWNSTFKDNPSNSAFIKDGATRIREDRLGVEERLEREHEMDSASNDDQGLHLQGSAVIYYAADASEPTDRPDDSVALDDNNYDKGRLWYVSDTGELKIWDGTAFVTLLEKVDGSVEVTGDLEVTGSLIQTGGRTPIMSAAGIYTQDQLFDALDTYIPDVDDEMILTGGGIGAGDPSLYVMAAPYKAERTGASEITFSFVYTARYGSSTWTSNSRSIACTDGSSTKIQEISGGYIRFYMVG